MIHLQSLYLKYNNLPTGATEVFGTFSGFNFNMPAYAGEVQAASLGMDIKCFDEKGKFIALISNKF